MGYLFYKSYSDESSYQKVKEKEETIIIDLIQNNSNKIEKLNGVIDNLNKSIIELDKNTKIKKNVNQGLNSEAKIIFDEIKKEIILLKKQIKNLKNNSDVNLTKNQDNNEENSLYEITELIKLKFNSGVSISNELEFLSKFKKINNNPAYEKMFLLNNSNFLGNSSLLVLFKEEMSNYISEVIVSENDLLKRLLSFIEVTPSISKNLNNKNLISLNKINDHIIEKEYEKSFIILKKINKYKKYFKKTNEQLIIAKEFNISINQIVSND